MDPAHIFFKELELKQDNIFTANFTRENEVENVMFSKDTKYPIPGLRIKPIPSDNKLVKIEDAEEQANVSQEIQDLIKSYKEPDLSLFMSHPETNTVKVPFVKKNESDLSKIKFTCYNYSTKKNENFLVYNYIGHFKKFIFKWKQDALGLEYSVKIDSSDSKKIQKKLTLSSSTRKKSAVINLEFGT